MATSSEPPFVCNFEKVFFNTRPNKKRKEEK